MGKGSVRPLMIFIFACCLGAAAFPIPGFAQVFGHKGGPDIENIGEIIDFLRQDSYDLELLLSFGTSQGGSAGHLALAIRNKGQSDELVYSANFYADRKPEHKQGYYTGNLICIVPKPEYLFKTTSSLGPDASFGLDMGEIYKRSVIGIRFYGVPKNVKEGLATFFLRLNDDFHAHKKRTDYHRGTIVYGYMNLNCAKTVALAFKHGAGFDKLPIKGAGLLSRLNPVTPAKANLPTQVAMDLIRYGAERGYTFDVVLYRKYDGSTYVNPQDEGGKMYKDLPNRFPSVLSLDYLEGEGHYEDYRNLYAMYLLHNLCKYGIVLDGTVRQLKVGPGGAHDSYETARKKARDLAAKDKKHKLRRLIFRAWGIKLGGEVNNPHL